MDHDNQVCEVSSESYLQLQTYSTDYKNFHANATDGQTDGRNHEQYIPLRMPGVYKTYCHINGIAIGFN